VQPPRSFDDLSDVQQRVVRFVAAQDQAGRPSGATDAFRRWKVPAKHADLRVYVETARSGSATGR
jgi:hypothetical protein